MPEEVCDLPAIGFAEGMAVRDGTLPLPDCPGIGFERQPALHALMRELAA